MEFTEKIHTPSEEQLETLRYLNDKISEIKFARRCTSLLKFYDSLPIYRALIGDCFEKYVRQNGPLRQIFQCGYNDEKILTLLCEERGKSDIIGITFDSLIGSLFDACDI